MFILICIGIVFLLRNLGIIQGAIWPVLWPSILIAVGLEGLLERGVLRKKIYRK